MNRKSWSWGPLLTKLAATLRTWAERALTVPIPATWDGKHTRP